MKHIIFQINAYYKSKKQVVDSPKYCFAWNKLHIVYVDDIKNTR